MTDSTSRSFDHHLSFTVSDEHSSERPEVLSPFKSFSPQSEALHVPTVDGYDSSRRRRNKRFFFKIDNGLESGQSLDHKPLDHKYVQPTIELPSIEISLYKQTKPSSHNSDYSQVTSSDLCCLHQTEDPSSNASSDTRSTSNSNENSTRANSRKSSGELTSRAMNSELTSSELTSHEAAKDGRQQPIRSKLWYSRNRQKSTDNNIDLTADSDPRAIWSDNNNNIYREDNIIARRLPHLTQGQQLSGGSRFRERLAAKVGAMIGMGKSSPPSSVDHSIDSNSKERVIEQKLKPRSIAFFDIACDGKPMGRVYFELFETLCPKTCENFRGLCSGDVGTSSTGTPLHYKGTRFFRIIPNFVLQGGDVTHDDGSGGECIWMKKQGGWYNRFFADESFEVSHSCCGLLSMANEGPNTNQSQFFITCAPTPWLDCRNVVFGRVIKGFDIFALMENLGSAVGNVSRDVRIADCGVCPPDVEIEDDVFHNDSVDLPQQLKRNEIWQNSHPEIGMFTPNNYTQPDLRHENKNHP